MDLADIKDIKPPVYFPADYLFLIIAAATLVSAALILLLIHILKKGRKGETPFPFSPPRPAHELAYEALEILRSKRLAELGLVKEYYYELSDIVRHYLENRFDLRAPEMTTEEFLYSLRDSDKLTGAQKNLLKEFLIHCDMVKFAKYGPDKKEIGGSFDSAKRLVDETKAVEEAPKEV